jgi:chromosome segregation ATPase
MEKGSFHTSVKSVLEMDEIVESFALPNQMPLSADLSRFPAEALRSSAIDSLISQNADLMARLGVTLKKSTILENKIGDLEKENFHLRHRYDSVKDQNLVIQEKERLLNERSAQIANETSILRNRLNSLERSYADIYTQAQAFERQIRRLLNYRLRIRTVAQNLRQKANSLYRLLSQEQGQSKSLAGAFDLAESELRRIQQETAETQLQLINKYEVEISGFKSELELLRRRASDRDMLYESKIRIENQLVFEERQSRLYREETQLEIQSTREMNADLRMQVKTQLIDIERNDRELTAVKEQLKTFETNAHGQTEQVESLQLLWREKQNEAERLEEKNRSLQKLNQQLSISINQQRKEIIDLKAEVEKIRYISQEKIKAHALAATP